MWVFIESASSNKKKKIKENKKTNDGAAATAASTATVAAAAAAVSVFASAIFTTFGQSVSLKYKMPSVLLLLCVLDVRNVKEKNNTHTHSQIAAFGVGCVFSFFFFGGGSAFFLCGSFLLFAFSSRLSFNQHTRDSRQLVLVENNPQWVIAVLPTQPFPPVRFTFFNLLCVF